MTTDERIDKVKDELANTLSEISSLADKLRAMTTKVNELQTELAELKKQASADTVSREEALKEMQKYHDDCAKTSVYTRLGFETAMNVIKGLPPTTSEREAGSIILKQIQ